MADIFVRLSDRMVSATAIDRHADIAQSEPVYRLRFEGSPSRNSNVYSGSREAWTAWLRICIGNAEGALDEPADRRLSRQAADRIEAALKEQ